MPVDLSPSFIKAFEGEVHNAYQRQGSKLRDTVRTRRGVMGSSVTFRKVGRGAAATKARHGQIPVMNVDHAAVECNLRDYYAGEWVDRLDDLKIGGGERDTVAKAGAYALGRKTDQLIAAALDGSDNFAGADTDGLTKAKVLTAFEMLGQADVPDDGERTAVIGWKQWSDLVKIEEFANADYVGAEDLPWRGTQAKRWLGTLWLPHSGLTLSDSVRLCHWYHKSAVGHAAGAEVTTDITWHGDRAAWFVANWMSQGAVLIDAEGVVTMRCLEN